MNSKSIENFFSFTIIFSCEFFFLISRSDEKKFTLRRKTLKGGGKKRKKKIYTKPKKYKHTRKKVKLRYMRYYDIIDNKIYKFRKNSPEFPGCFMAEHKDRLVCGKTGLTYTRV